MRTRLPILLVAAALSGGCELIVRFDSSRLDAGADVRTDSARPDVQDAGDGGGGSEGGMDVVDAAADAGDDAQDVVSEGPVPDDVATDVPSPDDVVGTDAADVQPDVAPDAPGDSGVVPLFALNGCDPAAAMDLTAAGASRTIDFGGSAFTYRPSCIRVRVGQTVTFDPAPSDSFDNHPLRPGTVVAGVEAPQPGNPVPSVSTGNMTVDVVFTAEGSWGYYCDFHSGSGMFGAVHVVP